MPVNPLFLRNDPTVTFNLFDRKVKFASLHICLWEYTFYGENMFWSFNGKNLTQYGQRNKLKLSAMIKLLYACRCGLYACMKPCKKSLFWRLWARLVMPLMLHNDWRHNPYRSPIHCYLIIWSSSLAWYLIDYLMRLHLFPKRWPDRYDKWP